MQDEKKPRHPIPKGIPQYPGTAARARVAAGIPTPKQERFCQEYMVDFNKIGAYRRAGYRGEARVAAYTLFNRPTIQKRLAELQAQVDKKNEITVKEVIAALHRIAESAQDEGKYAAAIRAFELLGKHLGMFIDKTEVNMKHEISADPGEVEAEIRRLMDVAFNKSEQRTTNSE